MKFPPAKLEASKAKTQLKRFATVEVQSNFLVWVMSWELKGEGGRIRYTNWFYVGRCGSGQVFGRE